MACVTTPFEGTVEDWKQHIIDQIGEQYVYFRETGANGWSRLVVNEGKPDLVPTTGGPHYIDASARNGHPFESVGRLFGTYNMNNNTGKFFFHRAVKTSPVE